MRPPSTIIGNSAWVKQRLDQSKVIELGVFAGYTMSTFAEPPENVFRINKREGQLCCENGLLGDSIDGGPSHNEKYAV